MNTKFAPGPWDKDTVVRVSYQGIPQITICDSRESGETEKANTRLIAAAPDMYEALKELLSAVESSVCDGSGPAQDKARAALSKAKGEA